MPEVMFVFKAFVVAVVITLGMQMKIGNSTMETHAHRWLQSAAVPGYLQEVSSGAVSAIRNGARTSADFIAKAFGHDSTTQKAGRSNLEFKRNSEDE